MTFVSSIQDGPAAGQTFEVERQPVFLRLAYDQRLGAWTALASIDGQPDPDHYLHAYVLKQHSRGFWDGTDKQGRRTGGMFQHGYYCLVIDQPDQETMRDFEKWSAWVHRQPEAQ